MRDRVKCTFGTKHNGWRWVDIPIDYIKTLRGYAMEDVTFYDQLIERYELAEEAKLPMVERFIKAGYHTLSLQYHPDRGGSEQEMREVNAVHEFIKEIVSSRVIP